MKSPACKKGFRTIDPAMLYTNRKVMSSRYGLNHCEVILVINLYFINQNQSARIVLLPMESKPLLPNMSL